ncbi:hypothetical protein Tco_1385171 [Tanacetum coccineum]
MWKLRSRRLDHDLSRHTSYDLENRVDDQDNVLLKERMFVMISEDDSESKSDVGDNYDDGTHGSEVGAQSHSHGVMDFMNGIGDA